MVSRYGSRGDRTPGDPVRPKGGYDLDAMERPIESPIQGRVTRAAWPMYRDPATGDYVQLIGFTYRARHDGV